MDVSSYNRFGVRIPFTLLQKQSLSLGFAKKVSHEQRIKPADADILPKLFRDIRAFQRMRTATPDEDTGFMGCAKRLPDGHVKIRAWHAAPDSTHNGNDRLDVVTAWLDPATGNIDRLRCTTKQGQQIDSIPLQPESDFISAAARKTHHLPSIQRTLNPTARPIAIEAAKRQIYRIAKILTDTYPDSWVIRHCLMACHSCKKFLNSGNHQPHQIQATT